MSANVAYGTVQHGHAIAECNRCHDLIEVVGVDRAVFYSATWQLARDEIPCPKPGCRGRVTYQKDGEFTNVAWQPVAEAGPVRLRRPRS